MSHNLHQLKSNLDSQTRVAVTPASAGWQYLSFQIVALKAGETFSHQTDGQEIALVPLQGRAVVDVEQERFVLERANVFAEMPRVLYAPPNKLVSVHAVHDFEFALGSAPATGKYPTRLFAPKEMKQELRGGGTARRQVNHILQHPCPAERLILFEVYVPAGAWSGWPPHCHDGYMNSPYLEETYHYRFDRPSGFGIHRNYRRDTAFDEIFAVRDGDVVLVTQGFHPSGASPAANMYFLNFLAGELENDARGTPPVDDPDLAWIKTDWTQGVLPLPVFEK